MNWSIETGRMRLCDTVVLGNYPLKCVGIDSALSLTERPCEQMFCQALAAAGLGQYRAHRFVIRSNCHYYFCRFCNGFFILQAERTVY